MFLVKYPGTWCICCIFTPWYWRRLLMAFSWPYITFNLFSFTFAVTLTTPSTLTTSTSSSIHHHIARLDFHSVAVRVFSFLRCVSLTVKDKEEAGKQASWLASWQETEKEYGDRRPYRTLPVTSHWLPAHYEHASEP